MGEFLLSVVIPTRNRSFYAQHAARQVLAIGDSRIQVIVHDNSDEPGLRDQLEDLISSGALTYAYHPGLLSFVDNFEAAVRLAAGDYVCVIGDDDGVAPTIIDIVDWAARHGVEAVVPSLDAIYYWPGSVDQGRAHLTASLVVSRPTWSARVEDPRRAVARLARRGGLDYATLPLVKVYHGIVKRDLLAKVRQKAGKCFGGLSPDIYSAVALSLAAESVVVLGWPLTIPGICRSSGSGESAAGKHVGRLQDAPHFSGHKDYEWSPRVPRLYSVETIWADSMIAALHDMGEIALINDFGYGVLERVIHDRHRELRELLELEGLPSARRRDVLRYTVFRASRFAGRVNIVLSGKHRRVQCRDIENISAAAVAMSEVLHDPAAGDAALGRLDKALDRTRR